VDGRRVIAQINKNRETDLVAWVFTRGDLDDPSIPADFRRQVRKLVADAGWLNERRDPTRN
jgi:hypothetical protein